MHRNFTVGSHFLKKLSVATAIITAAALLSACGGKDSSSHAGDAKVSAANQTHPDGNWTAVRWLKSRSDNAPGAGQASESIYNFKAACSSGPCDIAVSPGGVNGTYLPAGYTPIDKPDNTPYTLKWNAQTSMYEYTSDTTTSSCTNADAKVIQDAYTVSSTISFKFNPQSNATPASMTGTVVQHVKSTPAGAAGKCTDYDATFDIAAAPSDAASKNDRADYAHTYTVTEIVESVQPAGSRNPGFAGILIPSTTLAKTNDGYTFKGTGSAPTTLTLGSSGWAGVATTQNAPCNLGAGDIANAFTVTETWSSIKAPVITSNGQPILTGRWESHGEPTSTGTSAGCTTSDNKGYVIFIPIG